MSVAAQLRDAVARRADASLEYARPGYRLTVNPLADRIDEVGFIVWQEETSGSQPIVTGRAIGDEILVDDSTHYDGSLDDLLAVLAEMIEVDPEASGGRR